ncbi:MAG TPA: porin [Usitatibacter sp.]|nr:porin [Usitatibacter sp.]
MQKKALVMAVGAALVVNAALAQKKPEPDSVVELYGKVYPEVIHVSSTGATSAGQATCTICDPAVGENNIIKRQEMESSNSRFGVRGHEKLGGNLKAIFQFETQFLVDSPGTAFAVRDSFVGLSHDAWGTVKLGRFDTPFKEYGDDISFMGVSSGNFTSTSNLYRHIGFGGQNNAARFHERRNNAVQYESPDFGPFEFKVQYSTNEAKTATRDPEAFSFGAQWEAGPFAILFGYERHDDLFGLSTNAPAAMRNNGATSTVRSKDQAMAVALKYKVGVHQFEVDANKKKYEEPNDIAGRVRSYENNAYMFIWEARWNQQWRTAFHYIRATAGKCTIVAQDCNTNGLDGTQISVGFAYHFSRRTYLFVMGSLVKNGYSAVYNNSNLQEPNPGEDIRQIAVGIHTAF